MDVRIPERIGIKQISAHRFRPEVSDIAIGYYADQLPIVDGVIVADENKDFAYAMTTPSAFTARDRDFLVRVDGTWRWGDQRGQGMARSETIYRVDRVEINFWTGLHEGPNTLVILHLDRNIVDGAVPRHMLE